MDMGKIFTKKYEIHYYEVDSKLRCKLSSIIDFICDVGTQQSEYFGGGIEYCTKNNCAWVFYKYDIKMNRYPMFGETISITTQPIGFKKFYGLRKYVIKDEEENIIGEALALFFLINIEKRRPMRIPNEQYDIYGVDGDVDYDISMDKIDRQQWRSNTINNSILDIVILIRIIMLIMSSMLSGQLKQFLLM